MLLHPDILHSCVCSVCHSRVQFFAALWTEALQISLSMEFPSPHQLNQVVTGVGSHSLLQGIFLTQGSNLCLLHHRWILYLWVIMTSIYEFWSETIHPITYGHLTNSNLIYISNKVLGQVFLIWNTKKKSQPLNLFLNLSKFIEPDCLEWSGDWVTLRMIHATLPRVCTVNTYPRFLHKDL